MSFHAHYWVKPQDGRDFLPMKDLLDRIREAFPQCRLDAEKGRKDTQARLEFAEKFGAPEPVLESYRYPGVYCYLHDDVDPEVKVECMVWPMQPIGVTFATEEHERQAMHLLERLALSLDYQFEIDLDAS